MFEPFPPVNVDSCLDLKPFACHFGARLDFPRSALYFFEMLYCCVDRCSLDARYNDGEGEICPDAFFNHLEKYDVMDACRAGNELIHMSYGLLLKSGWRPPSYVYAAIDFNNVETWVERDEYVHKKLGKKETGSSRVHRYASIAMVSPGFRFTLAVVPVKNTDPGWDVVRRLVRLANMVVQVDCVLLDREFYDSEVYRLIEDMRTDYIGHVRRSRSMTRSFYESLMQGEKTASYKMNNALFTRHEIELYFDEDDDYESAFMVLTSNKKPSFFEIGLLFEAYETRWNIENTYCEANQFKASTNTVQHAYRLILYTLSHLLANLLVIMRKRVKLFKRTNMKTMVRHLLKGTKGPVQVSRHLIIDFH